MTTHTIGIILNGATGRICSTQHVANALGPIRDEGGLAVGQDRIVPRLMLVGRNAEKLAAVAQKHNAESTTDLDKTLADPAFTVFFDAAATSQRQGVLEKAIAAGKHIYSEKPVTLTVDKGLELLRAIKARGLKHGAVEDKLGLPGFQKLAKLAAQGFFGRVTGFRIDFGWWVFDGTEVPCQRPSWNYRKKDGGGLILDMYPHWRYVIENTLGPMRRVISSLSTATPARIDEHGARYDVDVDDNAATLIELENGATGTILSSWATRVRRDDLLTFQIDGTNASAVAGLHRCHTITSAQTPRTAHFSIATDLNIDYRAGWQEVADPGPFKNPYRIGWENYLRHLVTGSPMQADFAAGIRDVQFAEACYRSVKDGKWVSLAPLS
ncbi:MAG TPA: Gfo/Idh/MocA family oxidoreductase [Xanthobacteraceae bacterium]|jgi:predicted dehydrogenase